MPFGKKKRQCEEAKILLCIHTLACVEAAAFQRQRGTAQLGQSQALSCIPAWVRWKPQSLVTSSPGGRSVVGPCRNGIFQPARPIFQKEQPIFVLGWGEAPEAVGGV